MRNTSARMAVIAFLMCAAAVVVTSCDRKPEEEAFTVKQLPKFISSDTQAKEGFGISVTISGDYVMAGAEFEDGGIGDPLSEAGAAYMFV